MKKTSKKQTSNIWRKVTPSETKMFRKMIEEKLGSKRPKRCIRPKTA